MLTALDTLPRPGTGAHGGAAACGCLPPGPFASDIGEAAKVVEGFRGRAARTAFLHVLSHVIDWRGQIITMRDRAYLAAGHADHGHLG